MLETIFLQPAPCRHRALSPPADARRLRREPCSAKTSAGAYVLLEVEGGSRSGQRDEAFASCTWPFNRVVLQAGCCRVVTARCSSTE